MAHLCCVPSKTSLERYSASIQASKGRPRISAGSLEHMVRLEGGTFHMGSESPDAFAADGEGPVRRVTVSSFYISKYAVTNEQFAEFVRATEYRTEAECFGWSFVFRNHVNEPAAGPAAPGTPWWVQVDGTDWAHPEGPDSNITGRSHHPVVHVSWSDAVAFCAWGGYRLPTEAEWEYAARGGLDQKTYPWGDELTPDGRHMCNIWQGEFPNFDSGEDGFTTVAPVNAFKPNAFGIYNAVGNVWEWCSDNFDASWHKEATRFDPIGPPYGDKRVMKGICLPRQIAA
jgi:formylglycine-generating enzyme required for sulfatase activity